MNNSGRDIAKHVLLAGMLLSFLLSAYFIQLGMQIGTVAMGYGYYSALPETQIQIINTGNGSLILYGLIALFVIVPLSLFAAWYCYFSKRYRIGVLFSIIPIFYIGLIFFFSFPTTDFEEILLFWIDGKYYFYAGIMQAMIYWAFPVFVLAMIVYVISVNRNSRKQK